ncbi:MAG: hypothetical protein R6U31_07255 [bacterium]
MAFIAAITAIYSINADIGDFNSVFFNKLDNYTREKFGIRKKIEINRENNTVYFKTYFEDYLIGIDSVSLLEDYLLKDRSRYIRKQFRRMLMEEIAKTSGQTGLIGDIDIPVQFGQLESFLGEGSKLIVEGSERIEFNGTKTIDLNEVESEQQGNSWLPQLEPFQHLIVNVRGTVGERIEVNLKHNSQTDRESDNTVKIQYTGPEDDIIHTVEAGDINLSLPGVKLIGAPPQHKGLFGLKTTGQLGPVNFTAIASKETGESNTSTFEGNTKSDSILRYDFEFSKNRFFASGISSSDSLIQLKLYMDDANGYNNEADGAVPGQITAPGTDSIIYTGYFNELTAGEDNDYVMGPGNTYIELMSQLDIQEVLGVSYIVKRPSGTVDTVGNVVYETGDTLIMSGLKLPEDFPGSPTWDYMMKNVYMFSAGNIVPESFNLTIKKVNNSSGEDYELEDGTPYLQILGLDNNKDGVVDYNYVNFNRGYIIFPNSKPFADSRLEDPLTEIYNTNETGSDIGRLYYLQISYRGSQSVYSLGRFNILEGSEVVTVNGKTMVRDKDYTIDYEYGIVTFLTDAVNSPEADIQIDYQYTPFLSMASKNLLGFHMDYNPTENLTFNTNWLYRTLSYNLEDYPRIGEEPQEALAGEFDFSYNRDIYLLSDLVNKIPTYNSQQLARFSVVSKAGISYPNPNTTGKAYIEDMENILNENTLSSERRLWYFGSLIAGYQADNLSDNYFWYNDRELMGDINDQLPLQDKSSDVSIMNIVMTPQAGNETNTFVSLNNFMSKTGIDLSDMRFLEVWVRGDNGTLTVDIGKNIPEDMLRRDKNGELVGQGILNTEDKNQDGVLDSDEDTGLDGVAGDDDLNVPGDDGNDDYEYSSENPNDYSKINGTEGNNILDTEDKNGDLRLNTEEDLYRFSIDLNADAHLVYRHPSSGWKLYRVPLNAPEVDSVGNPDLKYIKAARIVWEGIARKDTLSLYRVSVVSNRWENFETINSAEEKFYVGAKNNQKDMDYEPPFNPGYDLDGKEKSEQSIVLYCDSLLPAEGGRVYRYLTRRISLERYREMTFYVRSTESDSLDFELRLGGDSLNYYAVHISPDSQWDMPRITLDSLVNLKRDYSDSFNTYTSGMYSYRGRPSLTNIGYIEMRVMNNSSGTVSTEIWVDDIMLDGPKREAGTAGDVSTSLTIPELLTASLSGTYRDPFFHALNDERGSGRQSRNLRFNTSVNINKLMPESFGLNMPLTYNYSRSVDNPLYKIGSDYYMDEDETAENSTFAKNQSSGLRLSRNKVSTNPFIHYSLDNMSLSGNIGLSDRRTYNKIDSTVSYSATMNYSIAPKPDPLKLFGKMDFYYMPSSVKYNLGYNNSHSVTYTLGGTSFIRTALRDVFSVNRNFSLNYRMFKSLSFNYSQTRMNDPGIEGSSGYLDFLGRDIGKRQSTDISYNPRFFDWITHSLTLASSYNDNTNYRSITVPDSTKITSLQNSGRLSVNGYLDYPKILRLIGSLRDEEKDSMLIAGSPPWIAKYIEKGAGYFNPLSYTYGRNNSSSYSYTAGRPHWYYQVGITDTVNRNSLSDYTQVNRTMSESYSLSSGMNVSVISVNSTFSSSYTRTGYLDNTNVNRNTRWPNVSVSLRSIQDYFGLDKFIRSLTARSSYNKNVTVSGPSDIQIEKEINSVSYSPLIGLNMMLKKNISIDYSFSLTDNLTSSYGTIETVRSNSNESHNLSLSYSFSKPSGINIPFFKKVRIKSNINFSLNMSYSRAYEYDMTNDNILGDRTMLSISPKADYNFSNNVTGGLTSSFSKTTDNKRGDERMNISAGIWVLFKF